MDAKISNVMICGIASCVPEEVEKNNDLSNILGAKKVKKQIRMTGISNRHVSNKYQRSSDLGIKAVNDLLDHLGWERDSIGVLIYVVQTPDYVLPSTAIALQERLGLSKECVAFDINLGCSAFNYGIHTVAALLESSNTTKRGLCVIAESVSALRARRHLNMDAVSFSMLFGSAGAAIALERTPDQNKMLFSALCDGANYDAIIHYGGNLHVKMKGDRVFDFAINDVSEQIMKFVKQNQLKENDIDYYVFHQAQKLIIDNIVDACQIPEDKVLLSLENYGNTSGVSVPLTLCANVEQLREKSKIKVLFCGFGVGLSSGITYTELGTEHILPVSITSEHYDADKIPLGELMEQKILLLDADSEAGTLLARYCDECGAKMILCGKNQSKLEQLAKCLFWDNRILAYDNEKELLQKVSELPEIPDGVIGIDACQMMHLQKMLSSETVFVVLEDSCCTENKSNFSNMHCIRFDSSHFQWDDPAEKEFAWSRKILSEGMPDAVFAPLRLCKCITWLLQSDNKFLKEVTLNI